MYICIYVYLCISRFPLSAPFQTHFQFMVFGIPTFSAFSKTCSISFFNDLWCPGPWEIVGNCGKSCEIIARARGIVGNRWEIVGNRGNGAQSLIPEQCVISLYITHTHAHPLNRYSRTRCGGISTLIHIPAPVDS